MRIYTQNAYAVFAIENNAQPVNSISSTKESRFELTNTWLSRYTRVTYLHSGTLATNTRIVTHTRTHLVQNYPSLSVDSKYPLCILNEKRIPASTFEFTDVHVHCAQPKAAIYWVHIQRFPSGLPLRSMTLHMTSIKRFVWALISWYPNTLQKRGGRTLFQHNTHTAEVNTHC